ncbi:MAG: hypothetical protein WBB94_00025 [Candidatus Saccharimonadaceae bacterium]
MSYRIIDMIEAISRSTGEVMGFDYDPDEFATALAAVALYRDQLVAGRITDDPGAILDGMEICDLVKRALSATSSDIDLKTHQVLRELQLPYLFRMHDGLSANSYADVCEVLEIRPFELFSYGITAGQMIADRDTDIKIVD